MAFIVDKLPLALIDFREEGVAFDLGMNARQIEPAGFGQEQCVNLAAADDHDLLRIAGGAQRFGGRGDDIATIGLEITSSRHDDILPTRQRPADRLPCSTTHDNRLTHREPFEPFQIFRDLPRQVAVPTDNVVRRRSDDDADHPGPFSV